MTSNHIKEELLVDYALGNITNNHEITTHLQQCAQCRSLLKSWELTIENQGEDKPSPNLKERLDRRIKDIKKRENKRKKWTLPVLTALGSAALIFLIMQILSLQDKPISSPKIVHVKEDENVNMLSYPETRHLPIIPVADFHDVNGNIWVNYLHDEMFVEIYQLPVVYNRDYQLWIVFENDDVTGEIISIENGISRILLKGESIHQLKGIKASLEPLGGSPLPTGPEPFIVELPID